MAMLKTFSMNEQYAQKIKTAAQNLGISESELVRRAVDEYLAKIGLLEGVKSRT